MYPASRDRDLLVGDLVPGFHLGVGDQLGAFPRRPDRAGDLAGEERSFGALPGIGDRHGTQETLRVGVPGVPEHLFA